MADTIDVFRLISKLQFHYWFSDKTHTMDALVHNKCERELLEITRAVAKLCRLSMVMETEPSAKGGLKSWLTITAKSRKTLPSTVALVNLLVASSITATPQTSVEAALHALLDQLLLDRATDESFAELRLQAIAQLKKGAANLLPLLDQHSVVKKRRSNFYDLLRKYQKVKSVSVALTDDARKAIVEEQMVTRDTFKSFLAVAPHVVDRAQIEIISPVLVKGKHKWRGMYQHEPISFVMQSDDFMALVQSGKVEFKSGSSITCALQIEKKITSTGVERIIGYTILSVSSYAENGKTTETPTPEAKPKQPVVSKRQLDLFGN
jgi:hypothetical protein